MVHIGEALGGFFWAGGWLGRLILALGVLGLTLAIASLISLLAFQRAARRVSAITLLAAAATMGLAAAGTWRGRAKADEVAAAADLAPRKERLRRDGYIEARVSSLGGLVLGVFPLVAGAAAGMAGARRQRLRPAQRTRREQPGPASPARGAASPSFADAPVLPALVIAVIAAILALVGARAEIPGRELDKLAWALLEHEAQIEAGQRNEGCAGLDSDLRALGRAEAVTIARDLARLEDACARHREGL